MKSLIIILFFFFVGLCAAQSGKDECIRGKVETFNHLSKFSNINYPGDSIYDVSYYKLDLKVNPTTQTISGNVTCKAKIVGPNVTEIYYDLTNPLIVDSVLLNGNRTTFTRGSNKINISLQGTFNLNDNFTTVVYYHGTPGSSGFGSFVFGSHSGTPVIWTLSQPYGAKDWWPVKDTPEDKADSADFWITVSKSLTPISNGKLMEIVNNGDGTHTYKWKSSYPIAQYLLSMAITNYAQYTNYYHYSPTDSMPINHFLYPENLNANIPQLDKTPNMIEIYSDKFGQYPFLKEKYGHAQFGWRGGMEHQTISSMTINKQGIFSDALISHELAHMWYGDKITCKDWHHIWLNEGFATYGEAVIVEDWYGKAGYDSQIESEMSSAKTAQGSIWVQDISTVAQIFNGARSYAKGAVVLHMLRGIVGDSIFFNILRSYISHPDFAYGVAVTEDFQTIVESVSGMDLNYFFQEWIYGENYPKYSFVWSSQNIGGNLYNLYLKVTQTINSNPNFFTMPIQINVNFAGDDTLITVFNNAQIQEINVTVNDNPTSISFDPGNWILKTIDSVITGTGENINVNSFSLEQNYPNPFNPTTFIKFSLPRASKVNLSIYNSLGELVNVLAYGEYEAGVYERVFDANGLASGVYVYVLRADDVMLKQKMILMK